MTVTGKQETSASLLARIRDPQDREAWEAMVTHEDEVAEHAKRTIRLRDGVIETDVRTR